MMKIIDKKYRLPLLMLAALLVTGCSTAPKIVPEGAEVVPPAFSAERVLGAPEDAAGRIEISDPWEGFNRTMYRFNYRFDKYVFLPVASGYQAITPDFMEQGFNNFFQNFGELSTLMNSILQLHPTKTVETTGRFLINTTVGLLGLFDVASSLDIPRHNEDFGQTLGHWGVGNGPFLVLPIMGPSNVRDGIGLGVDMYVNQEIREEGLGMKSEEVTVWNVLDAIDTRANVAFRYFETGSPFEYEWIRLLYTTKRRMDIER